MEIFENSILRYLLSVNDIDRVKYLECLMANIKHCDQPAELTNIDSIMKLPNLSLLTLQQKRTEITGDSVTRIS